MEFGAALALSSSCLTVARFAASMAMGVNDLRQRYRAAGRDIDGLAAQVSTVEAALSQLSSILANPASGMGCSRRVSASLQSCVGACSAVVVDIQEHIQQVRPDGDGAIGFGGRIAHLWSGEMVQQYERRLASQVQALQFLITVSQM
jgi:hypothetical protein